MNLLYKEEVEMTDNKMALQWIEEMKAMLNPDNVVWIDGSEEQLNALRASNCSFEPSIQTTLSGLSIAFISSIH